MASLPRLLRCAAGAAVILSCFGFAMPRTGADSAESPQEIELAVECASRVTVEHRRAQVRIRFVVPSATLTLRRCEQRARSNRRGQLPDSLLTPLRC